MESCSHTEYRQSFYLTLHSEGLLFHGPPYLILLLPPRPPLLLVHKPLPENLAVEKRRSVKKEAGGTARLCGASARAVLAHGSWARRCGRRGAGADLAGPPQPTSPPAGRAGPCTQRRLHFGRCLFASDNNVPIYRQSSNGKRGKGLVSRSQICWDQAEKKLNRNVI